MHIDCKAGDIIILKQTHSSTAAIGSLRKSTEYVDFMLARVVSASKSDPIVRVLGMTWNTRVHPLYKASAIALSYDVRKTAAALFDAATEPRAWPTLEALQSDLRMLYRPEPYQPRYDRNGRLIPTNPLLRHNPRFAQPQPSRHQELECYAIALGHKRGLLPNDLSTFKLDTHEADDGTGYVKFYPTVERVNVNGYTARIVPPDAIPITVELRWLNWVPAEPVEEIIEDEPLAIAA